LKSEKKKREGAHFDWFHIRVKRSKSLSEKKKEVGVDEGKRGAKKREERVAQKKLSFAQDISWRGKRGLRELKEISLAFVKCLRKRVEG